MRFELADLSRYGDIRRLVERWTGPLHGLINNAACTPRTRQETPEGIEMQFATNVLGYFRLIDEFTAILKASAPARVVNVASYWAGGLDLNDLEFTRRRYDNDQAYRQSKQADRMLSAAFSEKLEPFHIAVNACHPGDVNSTLSNNLGFGGHETPDQGADTPVWLATHPIGQQKTGRYYEYRRESNCTFSRDRQAVNELYERCANYSIGNISRLSRMNIPKKKFFFQGLAVAQLPILPVMRVDTLHQLQIHVGLQVRVICHYKFIFLRVSDLQDAF